MIHDVDSKKRVELVEIVKIQMHEYELLLAENDHLKSQLVTSRLETHMLREKDDD